MNRQDAIAQHRRRGGKVLAVLPGRYPRELAEAMGLLAVEVWDPPVSSGRSRGHLQAFACSIAHTALDFILAHEHPADAFLFLHTCDTLQNLFTVVRDCVRPPQPSFTFTMPRTTGEGAVSFLAASLSRLAQELESLSGRAIDLDRLNALREVRCQGDRALAALYDLRAQGHCRCGNQEFYGQVRSREYLLLPQFAEETERFAADRRCEDDGGARRLVLTGIYPDRHLLRLLDERKVLVADDDLLSCGRRLLRARPSSRSNPFDAVAEDLLALPPCSSVGAPVEQRVRFLEERIAQSHAQGLLCHVVKFCETEQFDLPVIEQHFRRGGLPVLHVETEVGSPNTEVMETRLDAFLEMIR